MFFFFGDFLSNFYRCNISWQGNIFISSEHLYMARKALFFNDAESFKAILKSPTPFKAKKLGRKVKNFSQEKWDEVKLDIMTEVCYEKFSQNLDLKKELLNTANKKLVESSPYDHIWGIKLDMSDDRVLDESCWRDDFSHD